MGRLIILLAVCFGLQACNSNLLNGTSQSSPVRPEKSSSLESMISEDPETLDGRLEQSLLFVQENYGDDSFVIDDFEFANMETILTEALEFVQYEVIEVDAEVINEELSDAEEMEYEEAMEHLSEFALYYYDYIDQFSAENQNPAKDEQESDMNLLQRSNSIFASISRTMNQRFSSTIGTEISTADRAFARLTRDYSLSTAVSEAQSTSDRFGSSSYGEERSWRSPFVSATEGYTSGAESVRQAREDFFAR